MERTDPLPDDDASGAGPLPAEVDAAGGPSALFPDGYADCEPLLRALRALAATCEPPIGVGAFDVLYASAREVVVWYTPARDGQTEREVAIPCDRLVAAWDALHASGRLDEDALTLLGGGRAVGRWLLALLAQLPGVAVSPDPLEVRLGTAQEEGEAQAATPNAGARTDA